MAATRSAELIVAFHPQEWTDAPGESHDWGRKQLVPAPDRESIRFEVPRADATDADDTPFPDKSYEANLLPEHPAAPDWVTAWDGPYYVRIESP